MLSVLSAPLLLLLAATDPPIHDGRRGQLEVAPPRVEAGVEVDGRLITGQNPRSAPDVAEAVVKALHVGHA